VRRINRRRTVNQVRAVSNRNLRPASLNLKTNTTLRLIPHATQQRNLRRIKHHRERLRRPHRPHITRSRTNIDSPLTLSDTMPQRRRRSSTATRTPINQATELVEKFNLPRRLWTILRLKPRPLHPERRSIPPRLRRSHRNTRTINDGEHCRSRPPRPIRVLALRPDLPLHITDIAKLGRASCR